MTQVDEMYDYLKEHGSITGMEAITELGIMNYKGRICDLRQLGVPIDTVYETRINSKGERKTFARYIFKGD